MNTSAENDPSGLPLFEARADTVYTLEVVVELTGVSSQTILHYLELGLISPAADGDRFNDEALRALRRIEHLRSRYGMNTDGLRLMLNLLEEVDRLRAELRARR
jgi:DNA-binding transcriptional MerR regulator